MTFSLQEEGRMKRVFASLASLALVLGVLSATWGSPATGDKSKPAEQQPGTSQKSPTHPKSPTKQEKLGNKVVDLNKASEKDLRMVPGIGKARAEKIIKARPLTSVNDLVSKKIMSAKELDKIRANVTVSK